jgi:hypothetical protein
MAEAIVLPIDFAERLVWEQTPSVVSFYIGGLVVAFRNRSHGFIPDAELKRAARIPDPAGASRLACAARLVDETDGGLQIVDFKERTLREAIAAEKRSAKAKRAARKRHRTEVEQLSLERSGLEVVRVNPPPDSEQEPSTCSPPHTPPEEETASTLGRSSRNKNRRRSTSSRDGGSGGKGAAHPVDDYIEQLRRQAAEAGP